MNIIFGAYYMSFPAYGPDFKWAGSKACLTNSLRKWRTLQSIFASARRREGVKLFARRTLGDTIFVLRPESFFRATMTGADDLVTK